MVVEDQTMDNQTAANSIFAKLSAFDVETGNLNVIIETPKGSRNKFNYDDKLGLFKLAGFYRRGPVSPSTSATSLQRWVKTATRSTCWC
jgi:hypothetical protein